MMEILKRKLHLLKRDFEDRDGIYLMCLIGLICVEVCMAAMTFFRVSNWDAEYMYAIVIPNGLIAVGCEILNVYIILMLERCLVERLA